MRAGAPGTESRNPSAGLLLRSSALRFITLALLWLALTEGDLGTWWLGFLAAGAATLSSLVLLPPAERPWSPIGVIRFVGFFLRQSLLGGVDVALRALKPGINLDPGLVEYTTRLPPGLPRVLFANTISLLPGTLSAEIRDRQLLVHTLATSPGLREELRSAEEVVAGLFGVELPRENADE
ncbi:MAG: Na+/H+ antiporter subunit E [Rubrobacteraceae bacterium]